MTDSTVALNPVPPGLAAALAATSPDTDDEEEEEEEAKGVTAASPVGLAALARALGPDGEIPEFPRATHPWFYDEDAVAPAGGAQAEADDGDGDGDYGPRPQTPRLRKMTKSFSYSWARYFQLAFYGAVALVVLWLLWAAFTASLPAWERARLALVACPTCAGEMIDQAVCVRGAGGASNTSIRCWPQVSVRRWSLEEIDQVEETSNACPEKPQLRLRSHWVELGSGERINGTGAWVLQHLLEGKQLFCDGVL